MKKFIVDPTEKMSGHFVNIKPAIEFIPDWYRKSNSKITGTNSELSIANPAMTNSTYKRCTPLLDAMTSGYISFLTADIEVMLKDNGMPYLLWRTERKIITEHTVEQWEGFPCPNGYAPFVYKWYNQMSIKMPNGYSLLVTNPINRFDLPFTTITGFVDSDIYNLPIQFPFFIKKGFTGIIEAGTPIAQMIPIKRNNWKIEVKKENSEKFNILSEKYLSTIKRSYKNNFWFRKKYE
jgi:hypothetical protein